MPWFGGKIRAMIRPFALADVLLVQRLQRSSATLAIEHVLTHPRTPLWLALTAPWPWAGAGVATYVLREKNHGAGGTGFVQLMKRADRPEADLLHMAPALPADGNGGGGAEGVWRKLLLHCCQEAAQHGLERIFVSVPDETNEAACLMDAGFRLYTRETVFRLAAVPRVSEGPPLGFRRQRPQDSWAMQRLYTRTTPRLVQQAEGSVTGQVGSPRLSWWEPERWRGLVWAPAGEVRGAVQVHTGRAGHWMRIWGASALTARELRELIQQGLRLLNQSSFRWPRRSLPVYATVRDYEIGLSGALTGFGFAPYVRRARFVRHTLAACRERVPATLGTLEARGEVPARSQARIGYRLAPRTFDEVD
jgi:hypothetical protein